MINQSVHCADFSFTVPHVVLSFIHEKKRGRGLFKGFHPFHSSEVSKLVFKNLSINLRVGLRVVSAALNGAFVDEGFEFGKQLSTELYLACTQIV